MGRLYLVDSYNVILQDRDLNEILDYEGLAAARRAMKDVTETFAQRSGSRVRLIFDGAQDPHSHIENSENQWIEVSFTSTGEKADERLVAVALECRRRGEKPAIVSDDIDGIREPLGNEGFQLLSSAQFARLLRGGDGRPREEREKTLPDASMRRLEDEFLARDARTRRRAEEEKLRAESAAAEADTHRASPAASGAVGSSPGPLSPASGREPSASGAPSSPARATPAPAAKAPEPRRPSAEELARKERGQRRQARRLALLQSRRRKN